MKISQPDSRTILVESDTGTAFHVPYRFFWNGHDREPESIVLDGAAAGRRGWGEVRAFFLFGTVKDRISADAAGITLLRTWSVTSPGSVRLSIDLEFDAREASSCLFPGVNASKGLPVKPVSFLADRTSWPGAIVLSLGRRGAAVFARSASCGGIGGSVGVWRRDVEDEGPRLCVQVRFPGVEFSSARGGEEEGPAIESPGSLERSHEVFLAFSRREEIHAQGTAAALRRVVQGRGAGREAFPSVDSGLLARAVSGALSTHLLEKGGIAGIREVPGSKWLSSSAGLGISLAIRRLFPGDARLGELALRLADFSLKGQHPAGLFYESFDADTGTWRGVRGRKRGEVVSLEQSARAAELLLALSDLLELEGLPHEKYFLAGLRFVDFFVDEKGRLGIPGDLHAPGEKAPAPAPESAARGAPGVRTAPGVRGIAGLSIFFPLARVAAKTGRDRYRKALDVIVRRFSESPWDAFAPPARRDDRDPDSEAAMLAARLFAGMRSLGYRPVEPAGSAGRSRGGSESSALLFSSLLVPWIRLEEPGKDGGAPGSLPLSPATGCLVDSFARQRVLSAGNETARLLLSLRALAKEAWLRSVLKGCARLCLGAAQRVPPGASFPNGPVDSRRLAREVESGLALAKEFPGL